MEKFGIIVRIVMAGLLVGQLAACATTSDHSTAKNAEADNSSAFVSVPPELETTVSRHQVYFVEFNARASIIGGHAYLVHGPISKDGDTSENTIVGFAPKGGLFGLAAGAVSAPGTYKQQPLDTALRPIVTHRVNLTDDQYRLLLQYIEAEKASNKSWSWFGYNCNMFVGGAAEAVGLTAPESDASSPIYVSNLKRLNLG